MAEQPEAAEGPPATVRIVQNALGRPVWTLTLHPDSLEFDPGHGTRPTVIARTEIAERVGLHNGLILRRVLAVELEPEGEKTLFMLEPEDFDQVDRWLGPPSREDLRRELKTRMGLAWTLPVGLLFVYAGLAQKADPTQEFVATGLEAQRVALGALLIALGAMGRFYPRRWLFLLYAFWFSAFSADRIIDAFGGRNLLFQIPLAVAGILLAIGGLRQFYRFAIMSPHTAIDAARSAS